MDKLKTLKGLTIDSGLIVGQTELIERLKQEASKWIEPNDWGDFWKWMRDNKGCDYESKGVIPTEFIGYWIEYFFNVTPVNAKTKEDKNG